MAVYTKITFDELKNHLLRYKIGDLIGFQEIIDGIDNSNFIITTSKDKFIFTIFESRIDTNVLPYFINFKEHLANNNIPCPKPIKDKDGFNIVDFKGKKSAIVTFLNGLSLKTSLDGYYHNISVEHCEKIGESLSKIHESSTQFKSFNHNDLDIKGISKLFDKFKHLLQNYDSSLVTLIPEAVNLVQSNWNESLPSGPCHLDLFPDNVFFENDNISAIIDFYFSANDLFVYDFAITVNAWCFDITKFNSKKFLSLLNSYQKVRKFSKTEIDFLPTALICASTRFLVTRLHDYFFTPQNSLVKIKNPQEYKEKLLFFVNNKIELS